MVPRSECYTAWHPPGEGGRDSLPVMAAAFTTAVCVYPIYGQVCICDVGSMAERYPLRALAGDKKPIFSLWVTSAADHCSNKGCLVAVQMKRL